MSEGARDDGGTAPRPWTELLPRRTPRSSADRAAGPSNVLLFAELIAVFFALPIALWWLRTNGYRVPVVPVLLLLLAGAWWLRWHALDFDHGALWRRPRREEIARIALRFGVCGLVLVAYTALFEAQHLARFPLERTWLWLLIIVAYPVFSVFPQEVICRVFFFWRYRDLFQGRSMILASAAVFGWIHVTYGHWESVVFGAAAGILFADTYARTRSLPAVWFEHALYGCFVFTIGLGRYFFAGAEV